MHCNNFEQDLLPRRELYPTVTVAPKLCKQDFLQETAVITKLFKFLFLGSVSSTAPSPAQSLASFTGQELCLLFLALLWSVKRTLVGTHVCTVGNCTSLHRLCGPSQRQWACSRTQSLAHGILFRAQSLTIGDVCNYFGIYNQPVRMWPLSPHAVISGCVALLPLLDLSFLSLVPAKNSWPAKFTFNGKECFWQTVPRTLLKTTCYGIAIWLLYCQTLLVHANGSRSYCQVHPCLEAPWQSTVVAVWSSQKQWETTFWC